MLLLISLLLLLLLSPLLMALKVPIRLESHTLGAADRTVKVDKRQKRRVPIRIDFLQLASLKVDKRRKRRLQSR